MKFHRLSLQAFGPYTKPVSVQLDAFASGHLFLIHGQTGAGKSSLLDGICFALYGESSGGDRDKNLRSVQADPDNPTEAMLEFSIGHARYRIIRHPSYEKPNRKRDGTTKTVARAQLVAIHDGNKEDEVLAAKTQDVQERVHQLVGFDAAQFRQVICLPQGQVMQAIRANSSDREKLLQNLFQTERYADFALFLKDQSRHIEETLRQMQSHMSVLLQQAECESDEALQAKLSDLHKLMAEQEVLKEDLGTKNTVLLAKIQNVREHNRACEQRTQKLAERDRLVEGASQRDQVRVLLRKADAARHVLPLMQSRDRAVKQLETMKVALDRSANAIKVQRQAQKVAQDDWDRAQQESHALPMLRKNVEAWRSLHAQLTEKGKVDRQYDALQSKSAETTRQLEEARQSAESVEKRQTALDEELMNAEKSIGRLPELNLRLANAEKHAETLKRRQSLIHHREKLVLELTALSEQITRAFRQEEEAKALRDQAHHQHDRKILSSYSASLTGDTPCPLCGSLDHPAPVRPDPSDAEQLSLKEAQERLADAARRLAKLQGEREKLRERTENIEAQLQSLDGDTPPNADVDVSAIRAELEIVAEQKTHIEKLTAEEQQLKTRIKQALADMHELESIATRQRSHIDRLTGQRTQIAGIVHQIAAQLACETISIEHSARLESETAQDLQALESRIHATQTKLNATESTLRESEGAQRELERQGADAEQLAAKEQENFASALQHAGFEDTETLRAAALDPETSQRLSRQTEQEEAALRSVKSEIASLDARLGGNFELVDPVPLVAEHEALQNEFHKVIASMGEHRQTIETLEKTRAQYVAMKTELSNLEQEYGDVGQLSRLANGETSTRTSFQRFVQRIYLDEVLHAANLRLSLVSRNRYQLVMESQNRDRRKQAGLGLAIIDHWHGTERAIETLSGGETFLTALAFSLGLADVIQRHSGGIHLDSLFIDEGFGSLDPEALDLARTALADLGASGRSIGVISHIPELKEQMSMGLLVKTTSEGSHIVPFGTH